MATTIIWRRTYYNNTVLKNINIGIKVMSFMQHKLLITLGNL